MNAASAITVVDEVKTTATLAQEEARVMAEQAAIAAEIALDEALVARNKAELAKAETAKAAAEKAALVGKASVEKAAEIAQKAIGEADGKNKAAKVAQNKERAMKAEVALANDALEKAKRAETQAIAAEEAENRAAEAEAASQTAAAAAKAVNDAGDNEAKIDQAIAAAEAAEDRAYAVVSARNIAGERRVNAASAAVEAAEKRVAEAEDQVGSSEEARQEALDATAVSMDAQKELAAAKVAHEELQNELVSMAEALELAKTDLLDAKAVLDEDKKQQVPVAKTRSMELASQYFTWKDNQGHSGYQFYQPYEFNYTNKDTEVGLRTGYVTSGNKSVANGQVSTWTDTVLSVAQKNEKNKYSLRYYLDINMPTGKSGLNGTNSIMSNDLVELDRFGEGWNYTPGVSVSRKISKKDIWTLETYYALHRSYTYDTSITNGRLEPGNEWGKTFRWRHTETKWQFVGEINHSNFGITQEGTQDGNITYQEGDQLTFKLNYSRDLPKNQNLMLYFWRAFENPYTSSDPTASGIVGMSSLDRNYFGTVWSKKLPNNRTFRTMANVMLSSGTDYNPITTVIINGQKKYNFGFGYDVNFTEDKKLSFDLERFYMYDDSPATSYQGYTFYCKYLVSM